MKSHSTRRNNGTQRPTTQLGAIMFGVLLLLLVGCWTTEDDAPPDMRSKFRHCRAMAATSGQLAEARECFDDYYDAQYPSIPEDVRQAVIGEYIDCLQLAEDTEARDQCDREADIVSQATREAESLMASVEAYDTRVAQEVEEATAMPVEAEPLAIPSGRYEGTVDLHAWYFESEREPIQAIYANELWIEIAPDGSVSGWLQADYDTKFVSSRGVELIIAYAHQGTFSGQLQGAEGRIDLSLYRHKEKVSGGEGSLVGDSTTDYWAAIQVEDGRLTGTVDADYFTFEASQR